LRSGRSALGREWQRRITVLSANGRFRGEADMHDHVASTASVEIDPEPIIQGGRYCITKKTYCVQCYAKSSDCIPQLDVESEKGLQLAEKILPSPELDGDAV